MLSKILLVAVLMVKNEAPVIEKTLEPLVKSGIEHFLIYDTGSTDNTPDIARAFFSKHKLQQVQIIQEEFIDFAQSRNRALDLVDSYFPQAVFVLFPDAEWYLQNGHLLLTFCEQHTHDTCPVYSIRIADSVYSFYTPRLIRRAVHARYTGVVHELLSVTGSENVLQDVYFAWDPSARGKEKSQARFKRDLKLLLANHYADPQDARTVFYLAQTYWALGQLADARHYYLLRTGMEGWPEEEYLAWYIAGMLTDQLVEQGDLYTTQQARDYYLEAYRLRPYRAEPLVRLALQFYRARQLPLCKLFAQRACELPIPGDEAGFIEQQLYTTTRHQLVAACQ